MKVALKLRADGSLVPESVVVLRVVNAVFPGAPVVSREFHSKISPSRFSFFSKPAFQ